MSKRLSTSTVPAAAPLSNASIAAKVLVLPMIWLSRQIDFEDPQNLFALQMMFFTVIAAGVAAIQTAIKLARLTDDRARVFNPGGLMQFPAEQRMADGSVSACTYDVAKINEAKTTLLMGAGIAYCTFAMCGSTLPMILFSVMQPLQLLDSKALMIYLCGRTYQRPWAAPNANHPLKQSMERKQQEWMQRMQEKGEEREAHDLVGSGEKQSPSEQTASGDG